MSNNTSTPARISGTRRALGASALVALAAAFIAVTILSSFALRGMRLDLTENRLYSIAPGTERILAGIDEPITLYFFFSEQPSRDIPDLRAYAERVRELLEEMAQRSSGKVHLTVIDPQPFSEEEDRATSFGLSPVPVGGRGESLFFGLAGANSTDGRETIGFFQPDKEEFLEYDVASLIYRLAHPRRPVIGLVSSLPLEGTPASATGPGLPAWAGVAQLGGLFDIKPLGPVFTSIAKEIDLLLLVHPKQLPAPSLYAIDQFVLRGGKVVAMVDPQAEQDATRSPEGQPGVGRSSDLAPLLASWGVEYNSSEVLGDARKALSVTLRPNQPPVRHLGVQAFTREDFNASDVVTAGLDAINFMTSGVLKPTAGSGLTFEPLIHSSDQAALLPAERFSVLDDPTTLLDGFEATGERYVVAARIQGDIKTAFPDGPPAGAEPGASLQVSTTPANLIIIADTDILSDLLWVRTQTLFGQRAVVAWANNGDFIANVLDNLTGSADLISIRGRQSFFRPFIRVDEIRQQADVRLRSKEQELDMQLQETERNLQELDAARNDRTSLVMTPEQEAEVRHFQEERTRIRKELRDVRRSLDVDINTLGTTLKVVNIMLVPALLTVGVLLAALLRRRKRAARLAVLQPGARR
jgi:ABC-type uncharacterized transport system involved in gliding motility auxiliary subunit